MCGSVNFITTGRGKARLVRRGTDMELSRTTEALHRNLDFEDMEEDDEDGRLLHVEFTFSVYGIEIFMPFDRNAFPAR